MLLGLRHVWNECSNVSDVTADRPLWSITFLFGVYLLNTNRNKQQIQCNQGKGTRGISLFVVGLYKLSIHFWTNCASHCPTNRPACLSADDTRVPQPCSCTYELINFLLHQNILPDSATARMEMLCSTSNF